MTCPSFGEIGAVVLARSPLHVRPMYTVRGDSTSPAVGFELWVMDAPDRTSGDYVLVPVETPESLPASRETVSADLLSGMSSLEWLLGGGSLD